VMDAMVWKHFPASGGKPPWDFNGKITSTAFWNEEFPCACPEGGEYHVDLSRPYHPLSEDSPHYYEVIAAPIHYCSRHGAFAVSPSFTGEVFNPYVDSSGSVKLRLLILFWLSLASAAVVTMAGYNLWVLGKVFLGRAS
ncbi:MAG: hypothetical protein PHQ23_12980, partial [Candidatus Wallbacteria bacterium]|nr:hypothetical protein [Candidatus Wallbacteria bacterium]